MCLTFYWIATVKYGTPNILGGKKVKPDEKLVGVCLCVHCAIEILLSKKCRQWDHDWNPYNPCTTSASNKVPLISAFVTLNFAKGKESTGFCSHTININDVGGKSLYHLTVAY